MGGCAHFAPLHSVMTAVKLAPTVRQIVVCGSPLLASAIPGATKSRAQRLRRVAEYRLLWLPPAVVTVDNPAVLLLSARHDDICRLMQLGDTVVQERSWLLATCLLGTDRPMGWRARTQWCPVRGARGRDLSHSEFYFLGYG